MKGTRAHKEERPGREVKQCLQQVNLRYADPKILFHLPPTAYFPRPNVGDLLPAHQAASSLVSTDHSIYSIYMYIYIIDLYSSIHYSDFAYIICCHICYHLLSFELDFGPDYFGHLGHDFLCEAGL